MVAPLGNDYSKKLKTPELKSEAYKQYCEHLSKGKSKRSWWFDHPTITLTWETMEKYLRESPEDFDPIHKKIAEAKGYAYWEQVVEDSAKGINKDANTASLQMKMRNKFQWDKIDARHLNYFDSNEHEYQKLMEQLERYQKATQSSPVGI